MLLQLPLYRKTPSRWALIAIISLHPSPVSAGQEWICKEKDRLRKIVIQAETYGKTPCKTIYSKPTEKKPDREIAHALNDFSVCEMKAEELALKLQNIGWECAREDS